MKTKELNDDLLDLEGVCRYFGLSKSTVRRKISDRRENKGTFPLPLFGTKCRIVFRKSDIESWGGEDGEVVTFTPSLAPPVTQGLPSSTHVRKGLEALGIKFPTKAKGG